MQETAFSGRWFIPEHQLRLALFPAAQKAHATADRCSCEMHAYNAASVEESLGRRVPVGRPPERIEKSVSPEAPAMNLHPQRYAIPERMHEEQGPNAPTTKYAKECLPAAASMAPM